MTTGSPHAHGGTVQPPADRKAPERLGSRTAPGDGQDLLGRDVIHPHPAIALPRPDEIGRALYSFAAPPHSRDPVALVLDGIASTRLLCLGSAHDDLSRPSLSARTPLPRSPPDSNAVCANGR